MYIAYIIKQSICVHQTFEKKRRTTNKINSKEKNGMHHDKNKTMNKKVKKKNKILNRKNKAN